MGPFALGRMKNECSGLLAKSEGGSLRASLWSIRCPAVSLVALFGLPAEARSSLVERAEASSDKGMEICGATNSARKLSKRN